MTLTTKRATREQNPLVESDFFSGAPLDFVKVVAACLMVIDHINYVFFGHAANIMWDLGRPAFPLFAFTLACNLLRGTDPPNYVARLILLGVISQPIYATLTAADEANILFTLAVGAVIVMALRPQHLMVQHLVFLAGIATIFSPVFRAQEGMEYGLAGMLLPAALCLTLEGRRSHILWLALLVFALNWYPADNPWLFHPIQVAWFTGIATILIALIASALIKRPRFLPRYALHIFYPSHLLLLLVVHHWV